jgi:hypothetical protein
MHFLVTRKFAPRGLRLGTRNSGTLIVRQKHRLVIGSNECEDRARDLVLLVLRACIESS